MTIYTINAEILIILRIGHSRNIIFNLSLLSDPSSLIRIWPTRFNITIAFDEIFDVTNFDYENFIKD